MKTTPLTDVEKETLKKVIKYTFNGEDESTTLINLLNDLLLCGDATFVGHKVLYSKLKSDDIYHPLDNLYYNILIENGVNPFEYKLVYNPYGTYTIQRIIG